MNLPEQHSLRLQLVMSLKKSDVKNNPGITGKKSTECCCRGVTHF